MSISNISVYATVVAALACSSIASAEKRDSSTLGVFTSLEWRGMGLAEHFSHGPGMSAGVILFAGRLRVGFVSFGRPGPINNKEFEVDLGEKSYRGKSQLKLRSDGAFVGLTVAPRFQVPSLKWLHIEVPAAIGQAAFGFYLQGDDRETPDGRRVSEWEDELFDGRDSSISLGIELGLRATAEVRPWMQVYLGVSQFWTPGYDALAASDYGGPSVALGLEFGRFR